MAAEIIEAHDKTTAPVQVPEQVPSIDEKADTYVDVDKAPSDDDEEVLDTFVPFPPIKGAPEEERQLTFRALLVGVALGAVVSASNIYLGLKTSWTFGASLFGSILGFAILKPISKYGPRYLGGGYFGPKENTISQTAATAAGGLGILFIGPIPAMYHLGLLSKNPQDDIGKLITFGLCTAYYGLFFAIALRKFYILKLKLIFPSPTAVAYTIRALHAVGGDAAKSAKKKSICLALAFVGAMLLRIVSVYAPGILWDHHVFWWLYTWGWQGIIAAESWNWFFEYTPAFLGAGILSGMNASLSFFGGSVLAWAIIGPVTVATGTTFGSPVDEENFPGYMNYISLSPSKALTAPSPRYWNLWVGVMVMLCASFAEVAMNGPIMYRGMKRAFFETAERIPATRAFAEKHLTTAEREIEDPAPKAEHVPTWLWSGGVLLSIAVSMIVLALQYNVSPGLTLLAVILAFIFSFIAAQSSGATDINPVSTCGKSSQLVFGGITQGQGVHGPDALNINMTGGIVAAGAASASVDMLGDLRTGFLMSTSPYAQFIAQAVGALASVFLCAGLFLLFGKAYPCITDKALYDAGECAFGLPSVAAWTAIATAVTAVDFPVPNSAAITALVFGLFSIVLIAAKYLWIPEKYHVYVPNMNAVGLAFTLYQTHYSTAMAVGAIASHIWLKKSPHTWEMYAYSLAAGLSAGEGIGGVFNAILTVAGVGGDKGSAVGCPAFEYCG
ncbi:OPT oligopeptide transporter protein-domain-containing protein [Microdochium trichocladiopsis]|uniref:OPT oligopeptide transporter protein-domain-containing protein n=1 Tax=Microdochium trichocladiopsis TaxID=1682393 RepID=A0A9P8Y072_9PEZI|nr:OPT oligopeptide transporter protein-domain-containing protein [Microdochium trichocladiopsis]KAH7026389.1 OPT oligopeptide transporter protein-domain-containing protein [Microdochium trichocladiopsis]